MQDNKEAKKLYAALMKRGYTANEIGDETSFITKMQDKDNRKKFYNYAASYGTDLGDYDTYEKRLSTGLEITPQSTSTPTTAPTVEHGVKGRQSAKPAASTHVEGEDDPMQYVMDEDYYANNIQEDKKKEQTPPKDAVTAVTPKKDLPIEAKSRGEIKTAIKTAPYGYEVQVQKDGSLRYAPTAERARYANLDDDMYELRDYIIQQTAHLNEGKSEDERLSVQDVAKKFKIRQDVIDKMFEEKATVRPELPAPSAARVQRDSSVPGMSGRQLAKVVGLEEEGNGEKEAEERLPQYRSRMTRAQRNAQQEVNDAYADIKAEDTRKRLEEAKAKERVAEIKEEAEKNYKEGYQKFSWGFSSDPDDPVGLENYLYNHYVNPETKAAAATIDKAEEIEKLIKEAGYTNENWGTKQLGGAFRGLGQKLVDIGTWDFGATDVLAGRNAKEVFDKYEKKQNLLAKKALFGGLTEEEEKQLGALEITEQEQAYLEMIGLAAAAHAGYDNQIGRGYKVGESTGESLGYMMSFVASPTSGLGKAAAKGAAKAAGKAAMKKLDQAVVKGIVKEGQNASMQALERMAVKKYGRVPFRLMTAGARVAGDVGNAVVITGTTGLGRTIGDYYDRANGQALFEYDKNGNIVYTGQYGRVGEGTAAGKAITAQLVENVSEGLGEYLAPLNKLFGKALYKGAKGVARSAGDGLTAKAIDGFADFVYGIPNAHFVQGMDRLLEKAKFNGTLPEFLEEVASNTGNALLVGDMNFARRGETGYDHSVFNRETNIVTFLSCAMMSGAINVTRAGGAAIEKGAVARQTSKAASAVEASCSTDEQKEAWRNIREQMEQATPSERVALVQECIEHTKPNDPKRKLFIDYAYALTYEQAYNASLVKARSAADIDQRHAMDAYDNGYHRTSMQTMNAAKNNYEYLRGKLKEMDVAEEAIDAIDSDPRSAIETIRAKWSGDMQRVALDYVYAVQCYNGMTQRIRDDIQGRIDQSNINIDASVNQSTTGENGENGKIQQATLKNGRKVYVVSGNITYNTTFEQGENGDVVMRNTINHNASDESIIIRDAETGLMRMVSPTELLSFDGEFFAEALKDVAAEQIRKEMGQTAVDNIDGKVTFQTGQTVQFVDDNGVSHDYTVVEDKGGDTITVTEDGKTNEEIPRDYFQQQADEERIARVAEADVQEETARAADEAQEQQAETEAREVKYKKGDSIIYKDAQGNEVAAMVVGHEENGNVVLYQGTDENGDDQTVSMSEADLNNALVSHNNASVASNLEEAQSMDEAQEAEAPTEIAPKTTATERIPKDEKGDPDYTKAETPDLAWDAIMEQTEGDAEMAQELADDMVKESEKKLEEAKKARLKDGASAQERLNFMKAYKASVEAAQAELDAWTAIADTQKRRAEEAKKAEEETKATETPETPAVSNEQSEKENNDNPQAETGEPQAETGEPQAEEEAQTTETPETPAASNEQSEKENNDNPQAETGEPQAEEEEKVAENSEKEEVNTQETKAETKTDEGTTEQTSSRQRSENVFEKAARIDAENHAKSVREAAKPFENGKVKIVVYDTKVDLPAGVRKKVNAGKKVFAWANTKDGVPYVYLYAPAFRGSKGKAELQKTLLHEIVQHVGMEQLLGDKFKPLMYQLWNENMTDALRNQYAQYVWDNNWSVGDGLKRREALLPGRSDVSWDDLTEEEKTKVMADMALQVEAADEWLAKELEDRGVHEKSWFQKFADAIREILRKMGLNVKLSDSEIADLQRQSYELMTGQKAGSQETVSTEQGIPLVESSNNGNSVRFNVATEDNETIVINGKKWSAEGYRNYCIDKLVKDKKITKEQAEAIKEKMAKYKDFAKRQGEESSEMQTWNETLVQVDQKGRPIFSVVIKDAEYPLNFGISLVCKRRRALDEVMGELVRSGLINQLKNDPMNIVAINRIIRDHGLEIGCDFCYVEARRFRSIPNSDTFTKSWNEMIRSLDPQGKYSIDHHNFGDNEKLAEEDATMSNLLRDADNKDLDFSYLDKVMEENGKKSVPYKQAAFIKAHPEVRKLLDRGDFVESNGFSNVHAKEDRILKLMNSNFGASNPKNSFGDTPYNADFLTKSQTFTLKRAHAVGGVRFQSFDDFVGKNWFDYLQAHTDMAIKALPAHSYTKEELYVKEFGLTGNKINMSAVPLQKEGCEPGLDENGNYLWHEGYLIDVNRKGEKVIVTTDRQTFPYDEAVKIRSAKGYLIDVNRKGEKVIVTTDRQTFPYDEAVKIRSAKGYRDNCGIIAIGVSDAHIWKMQHDKNFDMIIGYHKSSLNSHLAAAMGIESWSDYTNVQNERFAATGKKLKAKNKDGRNDQDLIDRIPNINLLMSPKEVGGQEMDGREAVEQYVRFCEDNGILPKFDKFAYKHENDDLNAPIVLDENGRKVIDEGYYKHIADFKLYAQDENGNEYFVPQRAVKLNLPTSEDAFGSFEELTTRGVQEWQDIKDSIQEEMYPSDERAGIIQDIQDKIINGDMVQKLHEEADAREKALAEARKNGTRFRVIDDAEPHKQAQLDIILQSNPAEDDYHTWIRKAEDIKTFDDILAEAENNQSEYGSLTYPDMNIEEMREAARTGEITIYSSKPIRNGVFVTPSRMNAEDYAGGGRVYSKKVSTDDVAWIAEDEGQFAKVLNKGVDEGDVRFRTEQSEAKRKRAEETLSTVASQKTPELVERMSQDTEDDYRFRIGNKRKAEMEDILTRKRPDVTEEQRTALFDYLDGLENTKAEVAVFNWFKNGRVAIPEDNYKIEQALEVMSKNPSADPMRYKSPMELIDEYAKPEEEATTFDPSTKVYFTNPRKIGDVTIYDMKDDKEAAKDFCETVMQKYYETSPWCLMAWGNRGEWTGERMWDRYNGVGRAVAFDKDGKPVAFMSSDTGTRTWWDETDSPSTGVPTSAPIEGDELGRSAIYLIDEKTGERSRPRKIFKGSKKNGVYEEWDLRGNLTLHEERKHHKLNGETREYYDGILTNVKHFKDGELDGDFLSYTASGVVTERTHYKMGVKDGLDEQFYSDGSILRRANYVNGLRVGEFVEFERDGSISRLQNFSQDKGVGLYMTTLDGKTEQISFRSPAGNRYDLTDILTADPAANVDAEVDAYGDRSATIPIRNGVIDGEVVEREFGVVVSRANFKDNKLNGDYVEYNVGGDIVERAHYKDGVLDGARSYISNDYYTNFLETEVEQYRNGIKEGLQYSYRKDNGALYAAQTCKNGKVVGPSFFFRADGTAFSAVERDSKGNTVRRVDLKDDGTATVKEWANGWTLSKEETGVPVEQTELAEVNVNKLKSEVEQTRKELEPQLSFPEAEDGEFKFRVSNEAENDAADGGGVRFSIRTKEAPEETRDVWKLMRLGEDGKLYPLYIDRNTDGLELGRWYDADSPKIKDLENLEVGSSYLIDRDGNVVDRIEGLTGIATGLKGKKPSMEQVRQAARDGMRWIAIQPYANGKKCYVNVGINGSSKSKNGEGSVSGFAMRPGWHAGSLPSMKQISSRSDDMVWVKGKVAYGNGAVEEAAANGGEINDHIPVDGGYLKGTSSFVEPTVEWYISGAFMPEEIMSDADARKAIDEFNEANNAKVPYDVARKGGKMYNAQTGEFDYPEDGSIKFRIGETKKLRNGKKIEFTRTNPTNTLKSLNKFIEEKGEVYNVNIARTGSRYLEGEIDGIEVNIRSANHTKGIDRADGYAEAFNIGIKDGKVSDLSLDLSLYEGGAEDVKALINQAVAFNNKEDFSFDDCVKNGQWPSEILGEDFAEIGDVLDRKAVTAWQNRDIDEILELRKEAEGLTRDDERLASIQDQINTLRNKRYTTPAEAKALYGEDEEGSFLFRIKDYETELNDEVATEGLAKMYGEEYEDYLKEVFHSDEDIRRKIVERAAKMQWDFREATEKYLGELANDQTYVEARVDGTWDELKSMAENLLKPEHNLSDNELRYILWSNRQVATEGSKSRNIFNQAADITKQMDLKVGKYNADLGNVRFRAEDGKANPFEEAIFDAKLKLAANNEHNLRLRDDAMRAINKKIASIHQRAYNRPLTKTQENAVERATLAQRRYDRRTIDDLTRLTRQLMDAGFLNDLTNGEVKKIMSALNHANGMRELDEYADKILDVVINNQLKTASNALGKLLAIRGSKVDAKGVEVQGKLDIKGQRLIQAFKEAQNLGDQDLLDRIAKAENDMASPNKMVAENAAIEYDALNFAAQYKDNIRDSMTEEEDLKKEIKEAEDALADGLMTKEAFEQIVKPMRDAIRQNHLERANATMALASSMGQRLKGSIADARAFREREKERVQEIYHNANFDMEGKPSFAQNKKGGTAAQQIANNGMLRFFLKPLANFDQMLRQFGSKSINGEGYLWNRFMRGWTDATDNEFRGFQEASDVLDKKVSEVFGKKMKWSDLYGVERKMPKAEVKIWDNGEQRTLELTQGNLLYIYMVNKMVDGQMKLRKMGIMEKDVDAITRALDPRFVELADWVQEEFLVNQREKYNEVYKRMFGASMANIENYFPLRILANARVENVDVGDNALGEARTSTTTGAVKKRIKNTTPLDLLNTDAFSVVIEHLQEMEHWAAFAEYNRDLNTLLSYNHFKNQVMNMATVYGSGNVLWNNFKDCAKLSAGTYEPTNGKNDNIDKLALNVAKGVTGAKISFRFYTALKQILSAPAFWSDINIAGIQKGITHPQEVFKWAMDNLPLFSKRWLSRQAGNEKLMETDMDWRVWHTKFVEAAARWGMTANAAVDAFTVALGAKMVYDSRYMNYIKDGYAHEQADRRAKQDAAIVYNESQQSNEGAFLSTMQVDRSFLSTSLSVFRNSSMGYQRQLVDSVRNLTKLTQKGYKEESIEFMTKQMMRDGLSEEQARTAAERKFKREIYRSAVKVGIFGFGLQLLWNLGPYAVYLLFGHDDDKKKEMLDDALKHSLFGAFEGLTGGQLISSVGNDIRTGKPAKYWNTTLMPILSDAENLFQVLDTDPVRATNDIAGLVAQMATGVNPQTLLDWGVAIVDWCSDADLSTGKEAGLFLLRFLSAPQSQIENLYFDEIDMSGDEAKKLSPKELIDRYAIYKMRRNAPLTYWTYSDGAKQEVKEKMEKKYGKMVSDRLKAQGDEYVNTQYDMLVGDYKEIGKKIRELQAADNEIAKEIKEVNVAIREAKKINDYAELSSLNARKAQLQAEQKEAIAPYEEFKQSADYKKWETIKDAEKYINEQYETMMKTDDPREARNARGLAYDRKQSIVRKYDPEMH